MKSSYIDYSMSVIVSRALPDGLKPVHRSVLYGMYEQGGLNNKIYTMRYTEMKLKKISVGMFNILENLIYILELFCGSGNISYEFAYRGAKYIFILNVLDT